MTSLPISLPPGVEPRAYQANAVTEARLAVAQGKRPVIAAPTGAGKTTIGALVAASAVAKGSRVLWIAHRRELVFQGSERMESFGLRVGTILAGVPPDPSAPIQVASIATLRRREFPPADVVVVDECHRGRAKTYESVLDAYKGAAILGLTATPQRGDGRGLFPVFDALIQTVTAEDLRAQGVLVPARTFAPDDPDLRNVATRGGDYDEAGAAEAMRGLTGNVLATWQRLAHGRRTLAFGCTVEHSKSIAAEFKAAGVAAEHLDGNTPTRERDAILDRLRSGETRVLANVGVCVEGLDIPAVECIILARPTKSVTLFLQAVGRGLRSAPDKADCIILDHAGNALRLGHPEEEREWSLYGKKDGATVERKAARCPECSRVRAPGEKVCACGYEWPQPSLRSLGYRPGTLAEVKPRKRKKPRGVPEPRWAALIEEGERRGYKPGWAAMAFREHYGRWPRRVRAMDAVA